MLPGVNEMNSAGFLDLVAGVFHALVWQPSALHDMNVAGVEAGYATACYRAGLVYGMCAQALSTRVGLKVLARVTADHKWCYGGVNLWDKSVGNCHNAAAKQPAMFPAVGPVFPPDFTLATPWPDTCATQFQVLVMMIPVGLHKHWPRRVKGVAPTCCSRLPGPVGVVVAVMRWLFGP